MQHISHIFIGDELASFRDLFAETYRRLHAELDESLFSAISLTTGENGNLLLCPDKAGTTLDGTTICKETEQADLVNYFEDMYGRKVTVAHPGNQSLVVVIWAKLYCDNTFDIIHSLANAINQCSSKFFIEVAGFTNDAVSCFIPNAKNRLSPNVYKQCFDDNIAKIRELRPILSACRLIANRNMQNVALDLNEETLARICAEYSALMCEHYLHIHKNVIEYQEAPFESFGISSIIFDLQYYKSYIRNRIVIDRLFNEGVENQSFNVNALAKRTNPLLRQTIKEIHDFYNQQVANAKATLALTGSVTASNVVGTIDFALKEIVQRLRSQINTLLADGDITVFESEALLSLLLGNDSTMFDTSVVNADEVTLDDIIDESAQFFINLDYDQSKLNDVSLNDIKDIRNKMRNIAVANRKREERLNALNVKREEATNNHIEGGSYHFGDTGYKIDLNIDSEPLEQTYQPHAITTDNVDLRKLFAPVRDQGQQGSCAAFAVSSVIEALRHDHNRYSPAFLYWNSRSKNNQTDSDTGASLYNIIKAATDNGACSEDLMPYNPDIFDVAPTNAAIDNAKDCKVLEAQTVEAKLNDIKSALSDGFPVIVAVRIFDSFSETRSGFVQHPSSKELADGGRQDGHGNHAMVVCGYSDKEKILVVRNSWGPNFGDNGYCYIPYSYAQQYINQACIITKVSAGGDISTIIEHNTINFNLSDNNIEAAILQNLIEEDNYELLTLEKESARLRTDWTQNIVALGNVNNQASIIKKSQDYIRKQVEDQHSVVSQLQSSESQKVKKFKSDYLWIAVDSCMTTIFAWINVLSFPQSTIAWIIAIVITIIFAFLAANFAYRWRRFRQDLRDEIQQHAQTIDRLRERYMSLDIQAHIHGTILRDVNDYRLALLEECQKLKSFNVALRDLYTTSCKERETMSPQVPYPFRAVLDNENLDRYYSAWRDKMANALNLKEIFSKYSTDDELNELVAADATLDKAVMRGLRDFSMKEYVTMNHRDKWQFLPDPSGMAEVMPDLDARAIPFCPYNSQVETTVEKYIFIKDVTDDDLTNIIRFFSQTPLSIADSNPYAISILNIARYNIS